LEERSDNTLFEGLSRLMGAVIVGTSEHVCAAPMAAYLVRNQSRLKFSVCFKYIPVREVIHLITQTDGLNSLKMSIKGHDTGCFLENEAFHYLHHQKGCLRITVWWIFSRNLRLYKKERMLTMFREHSLILTIQTIQEFIGKSLGKGMKRQQYFLSFQIGYFQMLPPLDAIF